MVDKFKYTDEQLIARFQKGDEGAYTELVLRYRNRLMSFLINFVYSRETAEDLVQDTLIKVYKSSHLYKPIAKFSTWIYTIAANNARSELRRLKRKKLTPISHLGDEDRPIEFPDKGRTPEENYENEYMIKDIMNAINTLKADFQIMITLRDIEKLSYEDISQIVNVPIGTVKSRINRARLRLQEILKQYRN